VRLKLYRRWGQIFELKDATVAPELASQEKPVVAIMYSSLQGHYATKVLDSRHTKSGQSVVLLCGDRLYEKAGAVIHILMALGGVYKLLAMFLNVFPLAVLNLFYDFIARNRYHLFGKNDICLIPANENKDLFIS